MKTTNKNKPKKKSVSAIVNYYYNTHNKKLLDGKYNSAVETVIKMLNGTNFLLLKYEDIGHFYNVVLPGLTYTYFTHRIIYTNLDKFCDNKNDQIIYCQILIVTNGKAGTKKLPSPDTKCQALIPIIKKHVKFKKCIFINFSG